MDRRVLEKLEFPRIREKLGRLAASSLGRELAHALEPVADLELILQRQQETTEARSILRSFSRVPLEGITNIRPALRKARIGSSLEPRELLAVADVLAAGEGLQKFFAPLGEESPLLQRYTKEIQNFPGLEKRIREAIVSEEELADRASEELYRLRRQIASTNNRIKERLDNIVRSTTMQKYLQEPIVTIRENRYVIPVKQEFRNQVPGIVHDQSGSGATLFIEPMAVVELNNRLREYQAAERREVERILAELSQAVAQVADEISNNLSILARLDFALAKARYSLEVDGVEPRFNEEGYVDIPRARHPLLEGDVVPVDLYLGREFHILVITGPNTGGKTVTLKTLGLMAVMAQAGLHIPAAPGAEMAVFDQVFVDIGDEQSIEQSLSTFSGHMKNIIDILKGCTSRSLVLLDELGAGTDPTEGAALGMAILHYLHAQETRVVATTHYSELKTFAYKYPRVENASVEFDVKTLQPTYNLLIGVPGSSNAFAIAQRLGLPEEVIETARNFLSTEAVRVEDLIRSLEEDKVKAFHDRTEAERVRYRLEGLKERYEREVARLEEQRRETLTKARQEALLIVNRARREAEAILAELRKEAKSIVERERTLAAQEARQGLARLREELEEEIEELLPQESREAPRDLKPGEAVLITHLNQKGYVLEPPEGNQVQVQVGLMKVTVELDQLQRVASEGPASAKSGTGRLYRAKAREVAAELDLRGLTADEALYQVEKYLDDAYLAGLDQVYLIHGKGTGVLRKAVQDLLAQHPHIETFRLGGYREGGTGVTVAKLTK
ncbi:MAG: endonuclease MutS2 [bacterium]|jgi:DNA mismatch repair protein MutS2|nr:endonuclease MutS2 [Bacillota bacterium]